MVKLRGFSLFELILVATIVAILASVLLDRVLIYQEEAEKAAMEQTVGIIKSALNLKAAGLLARDQAAEMEKLTQENPMNWLADRPRNYLGEYFDPRPEDTAPGHWYFDSKTRQLVYVVQRGEHFIPGPDGRKWVRFRAKVVYNEPRGGAQPGPQSREIGGVRLDAVEKYSWLAK